MTTLLLILFTVAWAAVAFAVIRALVIVWGFHRRLAAAVALAIAGAFVLGSASPISLWRRGGAPPAPAVAPPPARQAAHCPDGAKVVAGAGQGHVDAVAAGGVAVDATRAIAVGKGAALSLGGWTLASGGPTASVCVVVDGRPAPYTGQVGIDRPDVATATGRQADRGAGFDIVVQLAPGKHTVTVGAAESDGSVKALAQVLQVEAR